MENHLPTPPWFKFLGLPPASGLRFFHLVLIRVETGKYGESEVNCGSKYLQILANQKAIGSGGDAKIVNVVAPRTTFTHLHASKPRS